MAFVASVGAVPPNQGANTAKTRCSLQTISEAVARPAAVVLLSVAMLSPGLAHAGDAPLVFDHDQSLSGANFANRSDLRGSIFSKSNCKKATFAGSDLTNAQLDDANASAAFTNNVVSTSLTKFQEANFEGATVANAMATNAKFLDANLKNADFTNANLVSARFDGADIEGADFTDSLLSQATNIKLCKKASGVNTKTGIPTAESLMCPE